MIAIIPIRSDFLIKTRRVGLDDQNQPVIHLIAEGGEPCRDTLSRAKPGESLILASYCPFSVPGPYKEYGPVFLKAQASDIQPDYTKLPMTDETNSGYLNHPFVLRAYRNDETIANAALVSQSHAKDILLSFFNDPDVHFVLARFAEYGCYALRIERGER